MQNCPVKQRMTCAGEPAVQRRRGLPLILLLKTRPLLQLLGRVREEGGGSKEVCAEGLTRLCVEEEPVGEPVSEAKVELSEEEWKVCVMC